MRAVDDIFFELFKWKKSEIRQKSENLPPCKIF